MNKLILTLQLILLSSTVFSQSTSPSRGEGTIVLSNNWQTPLQGGSTSAKELGSLLSPFYQPNTSLTASKDLIIYEKVHYLMPLEEAKKALGLPSNLTSKAAVAGGGFPRDSLFHYVFDGNFEGQYNKLYLITDKADQVVSVQLVAESPEKSWARYPQESDWHVYNFINSRSKAITRLRIGHFMYYQREGWKNWSSYNPTYSDAKPGATPVVRIDSIVVDPGRRGLSSEAKYLEAVRWYVPRPLGELIMHCTRL